MADVFACAGCGDVLTGPVTRVALPSRAHHRYGHEMLPALMDPGTYAADPEPSGPPWRPWSEVGPEEAELRGVFAPVDTLSFGAPGAVVVAPGDTRGTVPIPERCDGYCLGLDGRDGPNLACARCGRPVATRIDDCSLWQAVWLAPGAVRRIPAVDPTGGSPEREAPAREWESTPPVEPSGHWSPRWTAAAGAALAHLLAASAGAPVSVPDGLVAQTFGRALEALLPPGPLVPPGPLAPLVPSVPSVRSVPLGPSRSVAKRAALAGPGLPAPGPVPDIALVPRHPRTGEPWQPPGGAEAVPVDADVWQGMAFPREPLPVPATGGMPDGVLRDDPLPPYPHVLFQPDPEVFLHTLARLPAVRQPWLRRIYDRVRQHPYDLF
ncbi:hypothetical protein [Streptomyces sp. NBC_00342]|uniref:hypothetical protein n=1 Tax=Streptomyces sp. NBC_00342 TaxID=2975718 RepID=UPI002E2E688D|nr:hypothetical protein [Streptomyces sp. NBC_00342]